MHIEEVRAELHKLFEHSVQLRAETMKLQRESWVRPFVAGAVCMALGTALAALLLSLSRVF